MKDDEVSPILFTTDWGLSEGTRYIFLREGYDGVKEEVKTFLIQKNTALHIACQTAATDIVKILLTHPDAKTDIKNCQNKVPTDLIARGFENIIKLEFEKAQTGKELLNAISGRNIDQAKRLKISTLITGKEISMEK
ncbi:ankyrin repeat domain-containing protein [Wolbachia endosymbiont of Trichogramma pretiosum]|uniref:ankyrin repeat domain-containing protein n=1 Tax=Wolbachia endosymbiont of Trichogramma pretiosum TaxID=125593 RepID=UPI00083819C0|nr:ankyrin repeat domain-containing protein [Wolbachia endosymbiont of Trichogramma pretiosum]OCA06064.1 ankyrin repeat family protein [Wolbachia endosymbiont of Trichogramma pretiosum]